MVITGIPVTVNIYQWLAEYAAHHDRWFDRSHHQHSMVTQFCHGQLELSDLNDDDLMIIHDFCRWLAVLLLSFDGGLSTVCVQSFTVNESDLNIVWEHGISHSLDLSGWNRSVRRSIDYIMERSCSVTNFSSDMSGCMNEVHQFIMFYQDQLQDIYDFSNQELTSDLVDKYVSDSSLLFTILSSIPIAELSLFYKDLSTVFPIELAVSVMGRPVFIHHFFALPDSNDFMIFDKVKMHYNLQLFSKLDPNLLQIMSNKTSEFLRLSLGNSTTFSFIKEQLRQVTDMQLHPRLQLLDLVNTTLFGEK